MAKKKPGEVYQEKVGKMKPPSLYDDKSRGEPQTKKESDKVRMFHGTPFKIKGGVINANYVPGEDMGWEDEDAGMTAAFATSDIHTAARHAGPEGHIYEVKEKPHELETDWSLHQHDLAYTQGDLRIKREVGFPGTNPMRRQHLDTGINESRK